MVYLIPVLVLMILLILFKQRCKPLRNPLKMPAPAGRTTLYTTAIMAAFPFPRGPRGLIEFPCHETKLGSILLNLN